MLIVYTSWYSQLRPIYLRYATLRDLFRPLSPLCPTRSPRIRAPAPTAIRGCAHSQPPTRTSSGPTGSGARAATSAPRGARPWPHMNKTSRPTSSGAPASTSKPLGARSEQRMHKSTCPTGIHAPAPTSTPPAARQRRHVHKRRYRSTCSQHLVRVLNTSSGRARSIVSPRRFFFSSDSIEHDRSCHCLEPKVIWRSIDSRNQ